MYNNILRYYYCVDTEGERFPFKYGSRRGLKGIR